MKSPQPRRSKALIRANVRRGAKSSRAPLVARKNVKAAHEPMICERCAAVFLRKVWRRRARLGHEVMEAALWGTCPACKQIGRGEYYGRVLARNAASIGHREAIERRIANVARRAGFTQPERRVVSTEWNGSELEVLTTSQKLAHRIATELRKAFGGRTVFEWSHTDGSLLARWEPAVGSVRR